MTKKKRFIARWMSALIIGQAFLTLCTVAPAQVIRYVHTDGLGSVSVMTDGNRDIIERREYEPYGASIGSPVDGVGYTGHVMDIATGLTYMQQRYYDQLLGKFLSVDPVSAYQNPVGMFNRYKYAANNPYRFIDPDGRCDTSFCQFWGGVGRALGDGVFSLGRNAGPSIYGTVDMSQSRSSENGTLFGPPESQVGQGGYKFGNALMVAEGGRGIGQGVGSFASTEARLANSALVVRGGSSEGANSVAGLTKGIGNHPAGVIGFSAESANGLSLCQLCSNINHNQVGVTTVGQVRAAGGDVVSTAGVSPTHATVTGLGPEAANRLFTPSQRNPIPAGERIRRPQE